LARSAQRAYSEDVMRTAIWPALIAIALLSGSALAQEFKPDPVDEAAARREGALSWYTSTPVKAAQFIATEFERQTGIKVELLRTGGGEVIRRFQQEAAAGRFAADVITMSDMSAANDMARRGRFVPFRPLGFDKVIAEAKDPAGNFIAQRLTMVGILVRTDKVAAVDRPSTWSDLAAPRYKGMLVMADPSFTAIQLVVVATLSQKLGWSFYESLRANDTMIVQSHEQIYDTVKRGERVMAAESSDPRIYTGGETPANLISVIPRNGAIQVPSPTAIVKGSPHPNAAKLFAQFNLTPEIQHKFTEEGHHSPRVDVPPPPGLPRLDELTLYPADYDYLEKNTKQIKARFADIFQ
jgi:iron(III) transport system substrate-binding protein